MLGGATVDELDGVLRTFEGTHRFHNFASGLRTRHDEACAFRCDRTGEEWPLAFDESRHGVAYAGHLRDLGAA